MYKYIYIQGKKYYHYANYNNWNTALKEGKKKKKRNGSRYFIRKENELYGLYLNKTIKIW